MKLYTQQEVAEMVGVSWQMIRDARLRGELAYRRLGPRTIRLAEEDVSDWLDRKHITPKG